jgi:hypothetical protein
MSGITNLFGGSNTGLNPALTSGTGASNQTILGNTTGDYNQIFDNLLKQRNQLIKTTQFATRNSAEQTALTVGQSLLLGYNASIENAAKRIEPTVAWGSSGSTAA